MITFPDKLEEVAQHLSNKDYSLAYRRITDCALDVHHLSIFEQIIQLAEIREADDFDENKFTDQINLILELLRKENPKFSSFGQLTVEASNVGKTYGRGFKIGPVDLKINAGEVWGLVGENGNGKTTLLRILAQDLSKNTGEISYPFFGKNSNSDELKAHLAYIPQRTPKWHGSLLSNLQFTASHYGYSGRDNKLIVLMMIIRFGLWKFRFHKWSELSSGYKMRFELARTMLRRPKLLLLDEPLANLDILAQQLILEDLKNLGQSISNPLGIILSSQQLYEVEKVSDKIIFLKQGKPTLVGHLNETSEKVTLLELDLLSDRKALEHALSTIPDAFISFNGGIYQIRVAGAGKMNDLLRLLIQHDISFTYIRDISESSRRLFSN